ncbi:MAG: radical SAM protein [Nitrospirae bacterium]|nr:radical SAM protein [Nitrospirota bacterium]
MGDSSPNRPNYLKFLDRHDPAGRIAAMLRLLDGCRVCPRNCGVNRLKDERGFCRTGRLALVASHCVHHGEEPAISGSRGSGTIFFGNCNLRCLFCQNRQISQGNDTGEEQGPWQIADMMLELQRKGAHNINFVSPTHVAPQMAEAIVVAAGRGLRIPIVYNSNGYESVEMLRLLRGFVDIYMPDMKYGDDESAELCSFAPGYVHSAQAALVEMRRAVGHLRLDGMGVARNGLLVRHLVLPNDMAGSRDVLRFIRRVIGRETSISLMSQYFPSHKAAGHQLLGRPVRAGEYAGVLDEMDRLGLDGWIQELQSSAYYRPDFEGDHPFEG